MHRHRVGSGNHTSGHCADAGTKRCGRSGRNPSLGAYPCVLKEGSKARELYGTEEISERHRHRYEVNNDYRQELEENGMVLSGLSPDKRIVEMLEIPGHPFFVGIRDIRN